MNLLSLYPTKKPDSILLQVVGVTAVMAVVMGLLHLGGDATRDALLLERDAVLNGQVWRLATAHLVNLSGTHTFLNTLGLGLIIVTLWSILTVETLLRAIVFSAAAISLGWIALMPAGVTYVGFSGVTHGVMAWGGLTIWKRGPKWFAVVILTCLLAKLGQEFWNGAVPGADAAIGGRVSFVSHTLGSLGGTLAAFEGPVLGRLALSVLCVWLSVIHADREAASQAESHQDG